MPELPSGLKLAINWGALFDHGGNWFGCTPGHFWYWVPNKKINPPPFRTDREQILQSAEHAPVPRDRDEVKQYIRVFELLDDGTRLWRGEWLSSFPQYTNLDERDMAVWTTWVESPGNLEFLDNAIKECQRLADGAADACGLPVFHSQIDPEGTGPS